jgi:hypothetical protein
MRMVGVFFMSVLLLGGFLARPGGDLASADRGGSGHSRQVGAAPAEVMAAVRDSLRAEGLAVVSRADDGDRLRQVIPATALSRDPDLASLARFGDMIVTARVGGDEAEVRTGFAMISTAAHYRITATPGRDGKGSTVTIEPRVEEGSGRDSRRIARNLRTVIDRHGRDMLQRLTAALG